MIYLLSSEAKKSCTHLPMITFHTFETNIIFDTYNLLMFTSKQAVVSIESINKDWKKIPCIAIGNATAKQIEKYGGTVAYMPETFYAKNLTEDIVNKFKHKNILYLRPKEVSFDSKGFLASKNIMLHEKIIYETSCVSYTEEDKPRVNAIIIFTSPSTIRCFLKNFTWDKSYHAIVIGNATKKHLLKHIKVSVANEPSIEACIKKAKSLM